MTSTSDLTGFPYGRLSRRSVLTAGAAVAGTLLGAGALGPGRDAYAATTRSATARQDLVYRTVGHTGERLPAVGLAATPSVGAKVLRDLLTAYSEAGGGVIDTSQLDGNSERLFSDVAISLGITGDMFVTQKLRSTVEDLSESRLARQLEASQGRLRRNHTDLAYVDDLLDPETVVPMLGRWKSEGRIRYVGVSHHETRYYPAIEILMRNFDIDFIQIRYSIASRLAEERILPLAAERGIGVMVTMPAEGSGIHQLAEKGHRVPDWAADFGATTWAQFFLKYVLANPAVTVVFPAMGNIAQVAENMKAMRGPLPDTDQCARMVEHLAGITGSAVS